MLMGARSRTRSRPHLCFVVRSENTGPYHWYWSNTNDNNIFVFVFVNHESYHPDEHESYHCDTHNHRSITHRIPIRSQEIVRLMGRVVVNHACECSLYKVGPKDALTSLISTVNYTDSDGAIEFGELQTLSYSSEKMRSHNPFSELWLYFCP